MAEPLKHQFGTDVPRAIATMIQAVHPDFPHHAFLQDALRGYDALELMPRGRHIAKALRQHLPQDFSQAIAILMASVDQPHARDPQQSLASFLFMPHTMFVADYGLGHFAQSMQAQHALTQRFTAEFCIRPFLQHHTAATLTQLQAWATDPSAHVRRLVSEGTRPRLPWAPRLRHFQLDPTPVLALLELLKDDPELYVRRSVANNLNDIGKDHPELLAQTAQRWLQGASPERSWIVGHALRSAVKRGESGALKVLGFGETPRVAIVQAQVVPQRALMGAMVEIAFDVRNTDSRAQRVLVDFQVHYVKANGQTRAKVFKLKTLQLQAGQMAHLSKTLSLAEMTTRKHYPGLHRVDVLLNGQPQSVGAFELLKPDAIPQG
jgi:3-methyladenine DNA glycosylase AlkC